MSADGNPPSAVEVGRRQVAVLQMRLPPVPVDGTASSSSVPARPGSSECGQLRGRSRRAAPRSARCTPRPAPAPARGSPIRPSTVPTSAEIFSSKYPLSQRRQVDPFLKRCSGPAGPPRGLWPRPVTGASVSRTASSVCRRPLHLRALDRRRHFRGLFVRQDGGVGVGREIRQRFLDQPFGIRPSHGVQGRPCSPSRPWPDHRAHEGRGRAAISPKSTTSVQFTIMVDSSPSSPQLPASLSLTTSIGLPFSKATYPDSWLYVRFVPCFTGGPAVLARILFRARILLLAIAGFLSALGKVSALTARAGLERHRIG